MIVYIVHRGAYGWYPIQFASDEAARRSARSDPRATEVRNAQTGAQVWSVHHGEGHMA